MSNEFFLNAKEFELSRHELDSVFSDIREISFSQGTPRELTGLKHEKGTPLEYIFPVDPGVVQELFHPGDRTLRVEKAFLSYQTPSPHEPGEDETIMEYASLTVESELLASNGVTVQEFFTIAKRNGVSMGHIDVNYLYKDRASATLVVVNSEGADLPIEETVVNNMVNVLELNRPLMLDDLEALQLLNDALSA